jgi:hypothetical protein
MEAHPNAGVSCAALAFLPAEVAIKGQRLGIADLAFERGLAADQRDRLLKQRPTYALPPVPLA